MTRTKANAIFAQIARIRSEADDKIVSEMPDLLPSLKGNGDLIRAGTRINWGGKVKKARNDLWDRTENNPDNAPELWSDIAYRDGIRFIPETISADLAFSYGELGWWGDDLYKSIRPGEKTNVHNPEQYPQGWEKVTE